MKRTALSLFKELIFREPIFYSRFPPQRVTLLFWIWRTGMT